jgi:Flp pilus assembly protein TadD
MRQVDAALAGSDQRQALRTARNLVRDAADAGEAWLFLAIVRLRLGHDWRAERALRRALELDDGLAEAHNRLGILLVGQGNLEPGVQHLLRAGLLAPTDPSPRLHLAQAYALLGRRGEGERNLREAERLGANPRALAAIKQQFYAQGA